MTADLQQKINFLCEKLGLVGPCKGCNVSRHTITILDAGRQIIGTRHEPHELWPAPNLLSPEGHLMLEKALWDKGYGIQIDVIYVEVWKRGDDHSGKNAIIKDGDLSLALVLAAYDALHKE